MQLVELWTSGSSSYVILEPLEQKDGIDYYWVINGAYEVVTNKQANTIYMPYTKRTHEYHYFGDIVYLPTKQNEFGDTVEGYNRTIINYMDKKQILGRNLVPKPKPTPKFYPDEVPF
jgi:hypothetical protein